MATNYRQTANNVRDMASRLEILEQDQAQQQLTLMEELTREAIGGLLSFQGVVDDMARQKRLWLANDMRSIIANPEIPIEGDLTRERWAEIEMAFNNFQIWLETPIEVLPGWSVTPMQVISRRGNPPTYSPPVTP